MEVLKTVKKVHRIAAALLCIVICAGCSPAESNFRLCDYKHISIPADVLEVSDADIETAAGIDLSMKEVLIPKEQNQSTVELGDVVTMTVSMDGHDAKQMTINAGAWELGEGFDDEIMGKSVNDSLDFDADDTHYSVKIDKISMYAKTVTDEIAKKYYGCETAEQVLEDTKNEIIRLRVADYMYQYLINNSMVKGFDQEIENYVNKVVYTITKEAVEEHGVTINEDFWMSEYGVSEAEFREGLRNSYDEYLILCEFMRQEQKSITDRELYDYYGINADEANDVFGLFGKEYAIYNVYYDLSKDVLLSYADY